VKLLHTADWQIGMRARHLGRGGKAVREQRIASARALADLVRAHQCDAVLLAGDVFEDNGVDRADVQRVVDAIALMGVPAYVLPGNHDPLGPGSVWEHRSWGAASSLHVLRTAEPMVIGDGITLYPCPAFSAMSSSDPTAWIREAGGEGTRIGIAHGTVSGVKVSEDCYPIARDAAERAGLDYLALGHWHSTANFGGELASTRMAYSGTHETTKFGERDSGNALIVEITGRGAPTKIQQIPTGHFNWRVIEKELLDEVDLAQVIHEIETIPDDARTLLDVRLSGVLHAGQIGELLRLEAIIASRFPTFGELNRERLVPAPDDEQWTASLPLGVLADAAARLLSTKTDDARRALTMLYRFCTQEGQVQE
jgi:DNA repair exonuclease SbcCD nuclease subunit